MKKKSVPPCLTSFWAQDRISDPLDIELSAQELGKMAMDMTGVPTLAGYILLALAKYPSCRVKVEEEISAFVKKGQPPTIEELAKLKYVDSFLREVFRHYPMFPPFVTTRSKRDFEVDGFTIPANIMLFGLTHHTHQDPNVYSNPDQFDPDRFFKREEDLKAKCPLFAYAPQGGGNPEETHRCGGEMLVRYYMKTFVVKAVREYHWELQEGQDLTYTVGTIIAFPKSGIKLKFSKKN